jgi:hypothetical protein
MYSLSIGVPQPVFRRIIDANFRQELVAPYSFAFLTAVITNHVLAKREDYKERIAYMVDRGNPFEDQLNIAHKIISAWQREEDGYDLQLGSLTFADDAFNAALQAADVIAWSANRNSNGGLTGEFAPLHDLVADVGNKKHFGKVITEDDVVFYSQGVNKWLSKGGDPAALASFTKNEPEQ